MAPPQIPPVRPDSRPLSDRVAEQMMAVTDHSGAAAAHDRDGTPVKDDVINSILEGALTSQLLCCSRCMENEGFSAMFEQLKYWETQVWVLGAMPDRVTPRSLNEAKYRAEMWGKRLFQLRKALLVGVAEADPGPPGTVIHVPTKRKRYSVTGDDVEDETAVLSGPKRHRA
ncbi:hypothetical protein QFC24_003741 [Naganishia onofrii]|uniref:Uncharacterized protein n=1 Tax=Naganishia onofrii TaxID=1851511 RepID=A0ACC2XJF8_9TREE|nr:hypothetical protein QFC24_003741 [Naganishia onofrii]